jgi:hypothetical protein
MADLLEEQLAERLHALAAQAPAELEPPEDLELRVARARRSRRLVAGLSALAVAAVIVAAVATVAALQHAPAKRKVVVAAPTHDRISLVGKIKSNVVMLDARERYVVALDKNAKAVDTLVTTKSSPVLTTQLTRDHTTLWYSGDATAEDGCGRVYKVDIGTGATKFEASAGTFAVDPDGKRLAFIDCQSKLLMVRDLLTGETASQSAPNVQQLAWTADGKTLITRECTMAGCLARFVGTSTTVATNTTVVPWSDGVYVASSGQVRIVQPDGQARVAVDLGGGWAIEQVVPAKSGLFVVATRPTVPRALYRIDAGRPVKISSFAFGQLAPVP